MKTFLLLCLLPVLVFGCKKVYIDPEINKLAEVRGYQNWYIGLYYRCGLFVPETYSPYKAYPLIIYLHGYSDTTSWDLEWYHDPIASEDPCIVLTPKCPKEDIYGWGSSYTPQTSPMMQMTYEMLAMVERAFNLDRNRYYIYGTSMGGFGTYGVIKKNPGMFAAGYVLCGNGNIDMAPLLSSMPFWIFHGSEDPVVPVQPARDLYKAILDYGGKTIRYTEYQGVGHNVWDYTRNEATLQMWLLTQRKGQNFNAPKGLSIFAEAVPAAGKAYLRWEVPTEDRIHSENNVWFCRIYRDGKAINEVYNNLHSYTDSSLTVNASYSYQIASVNYYFLESRLSEPVTITMAP